MQISKASVELLKTKSLVLPSLTPFYIDISVVLSLQSTANWNGVLGKKGTAVCCIKLWIREEGVNGIQSS